MINREYAYCFRKINRVLLLTVIVITCTVSVIAQSNKAYTELKAIQSKFTVSEYDLQLTYKVYPSYISDTVVNEQKARVIRKGNNLYNSLESVISVQNKKYLLVADTLYKTIDVYTPGTQQATTQLLIDTTLIKLARPKLKEVNSNMNKLELYPDVTILPEYYRIDIYYGKNTYLPVKYVLYNRYEENIVSDSTGEEMPVYSKRRTEIVYDNIDFKPRNISGFFNSEQYFTEKNKKLVLSTGYALKEYQLNDKR